MNDPGITSDGIDQIEMPLVLKVQRARAHGGRVSAHIVSCPEHGVIGDPRLRRWSKKQAEQVAWLHSKKGHGGKAIVIKDVSG